MNISLFNITKEQTNSIKGVGITLIVLHNFLHATNDIGFNEMDFLSDRFPEFLSLLWHHPTDSINNILTYFGHYGVQLFIFISGYGLSKKYCNHDTIIYSPYLKSRLLKIYSLLIFSIFIYCIFFILIFKKDTFDLDFLRKIFFTLTTFRNFSNHTLYDISGPWWFFGLIIQLYLLFPFLFRFIKKRKEKGFSLSIICSYLLLFFTVGCYVILFLIFPAVKEANIAFFGLFLGHAPEFLSGIAFAILPSLKINKKILLICGFLFIISNLIFVAFPFSFLSVTIILISICYYLYTHLPDMILKVFSFLGTISMFIFVFNGPIRNFTVPIVAEKSSLIILLGSFSHFIIVIIFSYPMSLLYDQLMRLVPIKKAL